MRTESGGYRRDHLRALAQRVEVDTKEVRIMGSKSVLLRTLVAASSAKTAGFGVPSFGFDVGPIARQRHVKCGGGDADEAVLTQPALPAGRHAVVLNLDQRVAGGERVVLRQSPRRRMEPMASRAPKVASGHPRVGRGRKDAPNKPLVTSIASLVVGIFIAPQQQHGSANDQSPDGTDNRSKTTFLTLVTTAFRKWSEGSAGNEDPETFGPIAETKIWI
jgi:hypothetical protein